MVENVVSGSEELFHKAGYELLEGRYPTAENEIAIDLSVFAAFEWGGYSDNFDNFYSFAYDSSKESHEPIEINSYADLIGKRFVAWENQIPFINPPEHYGDSAKEVVIVGIYDTSHTAVSSTRKKLTEPHVLRSYAWQKVREQRNHYIQAMFAPDISDILDKQFVEKCLDVTETMLASYLERSHSEYKRAAIGAMGMVGYFDNVEAWNLDLLVEIFAGAGVVLLIFSVILMAYFITAIMNTKSKQVGLLRAFGTPKRKIIGIFIMGILFLAAIIFIVSLILTASAYFGWLKPWLMEGEGGVPPMQFSGWTVLILFGVSFITPVLSVLFPMGKFYKSSIVDNMKELSTKKKKTKKFLKSY